MTAIDSLEVYWRHVLSMLEVVTIVRPIAQTHSIIVRSQECFFVEKLLEYNPDDDTYKVKWKGFR